MITEWINLEEAKGRFPTRDTDLIATVSFDGVINIEEMEVSPYLKFEVAKDGTITIPARYLVTVGDGGEIHVREVTDEEYLRDR